MTDASIRRLAREGFAPPARPGRELGPRERRIINALQGGFPICARPFQAAAATLGMDEDALIAAIGALLASGVLTRFGPLFNADRMGGANVLAAMQVPEADFERVAELVNAQPEIAHNYRREHRLNLWFVCAAESPGQVESAFRHIEVASGYPVFRFPKEKEYFVELKLRV